MIFDSILMHLPWKNTSFHRIIRMQTLWLDFSFAFRNIIRQKRRSTIAIGAIAFGVTAMILASGFIEWTLWGMREATIESQLGHLQITRIGYHDAGKADPYAFLLPDAMPQAQAAGESDQIKVITPRLSFGGLISHGEATLSFIGDGVDPLEQAIFGNFLEISAGQNLSADDPKGVILGEGLARNLGVGVGDRVVLLASTASRGVNAIEVAVRGIFHTVIKSYDDSALRMPIETTRQLLRTGGSHVWIVLLEDTEQTDTILAQLRERFKKNNFEIVPWHQLADFYNKTAVLFTRQIQGVKLIIVFIILLSISNTMTMSVMERIGEIGTYMALGTKRTGVLRRFVSEGALLGCLGGLLGLATGLLLAAAMSSIGIPMPPPPGMTRGYTAEILVTWNIALESLMLALGTTLAASIYPAWKASRMHIVDALRHNR
jgi:putative ABC transport system permease protein